MVEKILFSFALTFVVAVVGGIVFLIGDVALGETRATPVQVLGSLYEPQRSGTGFGIAANGQAGVVLTSTGPRYELAVEFEDGRRDIVPTSESTLLSVLVGARVELACRYGRFTAAIYHCELRR